MRKCKKSAVVAAVLAVSLLLTACASGAPGENEMNPGITVTSDTLYVEKVENLSADFIMGMDASCVPALEKGGVKYYDHDGTEKDVYQILSENGINYIRVRV